MSNKLGMLFLAVVGIFFHHRHRPLRHRWDRPATRLEGGASLDGTGDTGYLALFFFFVGTERWVGLWCHHAATALDAHGRPVSVPTGTHRHRPAAAPEPSGEMEKPSREWGVVVQAPPRASVCWLSLF